MSNIAPISQPQPTVAASPAAQPSQSGASLASSAPANHGPAATLQLSPQALSKLQAQAKLQGDTDWRPGQRVDWA